MNTGNRTTFAWLISVLTILLGCASAHEERQPADNVKPIYRVRAGIVDLQAQLKRTIGSSRSLETDGRSARANFARDVRSTEKCVETLRADAVELRERASEYLIVWGGRTIMVTHQSVAEKPNDRREAVKSKYDDFVSSMVSSKDVVLPLLDRFKAIEASSNPAKGGSVGQEVQSEGQRAIQFLNDALTKLDELKGMVQKAD